MNDTSRQLSWIDTGDGYFIFPHMNGKMAWLPISPLIPLVTHAPL